MTPNDDQIHEPVIGHMNQGTSLLDKVRFALRRRVVLLSLAGVLVLVIVAVVWVQKVHHTSTMVDDERHTYEATVVMDGKTMLPATLAIKPDTEVFFENHSKSNDQDETGPAVQLIQSKAAADQAPNFSAGSIAASSGYGYIFRKSGTYRFFNASSVQQTVTVVVRN